MLLPIQHDLIHACESVNYCTKSASQISFHALNTASVEIKNVRTSIDNCSFHSYFNMFFNNCLHSYEDYLFCVYFQDMVFLQKVISRKFPFDWCAHTYIFEKKTILAYWEILRFAAILKNGHKNNFCCCEVYPSFSQSRQPKRENQNVYNGGASSTCNKVPILCCLRFPGLAFSPFFENNLFWKRPTWVDMFLL